MRKWQMNLERWINGDLEDVWLEACQLNEERIALTERRSKHSTADSNRSTEEESMSSWIRAKRLVNDGEFSKAARQINEAGCRA